MTMNPTTLANIEKFLTKKPITKEEMELTLDDIREKTKTFDIEDWFDSMLEIGDTCPELLEPYINWSLTWLSDKSLTIVEAVRLLDDSRNPFRDIWNSSLIESVPISYALDCYRVVIFSVLQATVAIYTTRS